MTAAYCDKLVSVSRFAKKLLVPVSQGPGCVSGLDITRLLIRVSLASFS